jgi:hypothetical protein
LGIGHWGLGIGHWALVLSFAEVLGIEPQTIYIDKILRGREKNETRSLVAVLEAIFLIRITYICGFTPYPIEVILGLFFMLSVDYY